MLSDCTIVFCANGHREDLDVVRGLFEETSARLVDVDMAEHDRRMALVLGLSHLSNLVFARAVHRSGVAARDMVEAAGVTFNKQIKTTCELVAENPTLAYEIQAFNSATPEIAQGLRESVNEWLQAVEDHDLASFTTLLEECRDYLDGVGGS
jgi:prephenate dehydrogenase